MTRNQTQSEQDMDRRAFLKALALTGVAATATGGGAALWLNRAEAETVITAMTPPAATAPRATAALPVAASTSNEAPELLARLASSEAENLRLQSELDAARRRLAALESANGDNAQVNESLELELASVNNEISLLAGLVALYEQLDDLDVAKTIDGGLDTFGAALGELVDGLPQFEDGLARGTQALDNLEAQIPLVQNGRAWLEDHLGQLLPLYEHAEEVLGTAVETAGEFLQMLNEWFQGLLKWLPFGAGDRAAAVMGALTELLDETPNTIQGLRRNVADPLDIWLVGEGAETPLHNHLVKPLKEEALRPAGEVARRVRDQQTLYEQAVVEPTRTVAKSRGLVRAQIEAYRKKYEI